MHIIGELHAFKERNPTLGYCSKIFPHKYGVFYYAEKSQQESMQFDVRMFKLGKKINPLALVLRQNMFLHDRGWRRKR